MHLRSLFSVKQDDRVQPERWNMLGIRPDGFSYDVCFLPFLSSLRIDRIIIARIMHFVIAITTLVACSTRKNGPFPLGACHGP
jgi:hypothetical protein